MRKNAPVKSVFFTLSILLILPTNFSLGSILDPSNALVIGTGTIRHDVPDGQYTGLAADPEFVSVGYLTRRGTLTCSAVLIAENWVLTAAHCVDEDPATDFAFSVGGNNYNVASKVIHPLFTIGSTEQQLAQLGYDIALLQLASDVATVAPAEIYRGSSEEDSVGTHVGFGRTGTGLTGEVLPAGTKRAGTNVIDVTSETLPADWQPFWGPNILFDDFDSPDGQSNTWERVGSSPLPTDLELLTARGDSGGGFFADFGTGQQLVGIHSFIAAFEPDIVVDASYGEISGSTRVSAYTNWIDANISAIPEPSSFLTMGGLFALAGLWISRKRRASVG